jgi:hypothetical protein
MHKTDTSKEEEENEEGRDEEKQGAREIMGNRFYNALMMKHLQLPKDVSSKQLKAEEMRIH